MSYISISTIPCLRVSVCTPHFKYNRKPIYFVQVKCLREKKFALWFSTKNLRRGAWLTLTKLRTRCRKTNGCCCRQTGPDSQTAKHPCIRNDNSYGFDGEMAQKKTQEEVPGNRSRRKRQEAGNLLANGNARRRTPFANCRQLTHTTHTAHPLTRSLTRTFTISTLFQEISHHLLFKVFFEKHQHAT